MILEAEIGGAIRLLAVPPRQTERVRRALSFPNPEYINAARMNRYNGDIPERYDAAIECPNADMICPRGGWNRIQEALAKDGWTAKVTTDGRRPGYPLALKMTPREFGLRDYQQQGIDRLLQHIQGLVVLPCGTGKTRLGVGAILALSRSTIVVVHTTDLADQWVTTLASVGILAGRIDADHDDRHAAVVVTTVQSLTRIIDDPLDDGEWLLRFGLCILDEAHHSPAVTFQRVLAAIPARWRLGLTATPEREDGLSKLVEWSFGPTLMERDTREMIRLGHLMKAEIEFVETGFAFDDTGIPETKRLAAMDRALAKDEARTAMIVKRAHDEAKDGQTVLVLANRVAYARSLAKAIRASGVAAEAVVGATAKKSRKESIEQLRAGELPVMVATSLADEGLDVQRLSRVLLAWPQRAKGGTTQRVGRLLRDFPAKRPKLIDFVDSKVPVLKSRASARRSTFRKLGLLDRDQ